MGIFERYLTVWVALSIIAGVVLGNLAPGVFALIARLEDESGVALAEAFQIPGLESVVKQHVRYARQNGIHVSPTFMVDGLVDPAISSGDSVEDWVKRIFPDG